MTDDEAFQLWAVVSKLIEMAHELDALLDSEFSGGLDAGETAAVEQAQEMLEQYIKSLPADTLARIS